MESADGEVEVHWDVEGEPANAVKDGDPGWNEKAPDGDGDSLGVCVDESRCSRCSGMVCSLSGKPVCYECRDRCSQCERRFYSASGNTPCVNCQEGPVDEVGERWDCMDATLNAILELL